MRTCSGGWARTAHAACPGPWPFASRGWGPSRRAGWVNKGAREPAASAFPSSCCPPPPGVGGGSPCVFRAGQDGPGSGRQSECRDVSASSSAGGPGSPARALASGGPRETVPALELRGGSSGAGAARLQRLLAAEAGTEGSDLSEGLGVLLAVCLAEAAA